MFTFLNGAVCQSDNVEMHPLSNLYFNCDHFGIDAIYSTSERFCKHNNGY